MNAVSTAVAIGAVALFAHLPTSGDRGTGCETAPRWDALIRTHVVRYPEMQVADLYKLLHQATLGAEHAVSNAEAAARWLTRELDDLPDGPTEPLVDTLGIGGRFARVHLRPFQAEGRPPTDLLEAFVATAEGGSKDRSAFACALSVARKLGGQGELRWTDSMLTTYFDSLESQGYPAVHHSRQYLEHYGPAYRVIAVALTSRALGQ